METIPRVTAKDHLYRELKQRILSAFYQPGQRLNIDHLARELQVSNSPLREAINLLVKDGLVTTTTHTGPRVAEFGKRDIEELNQSTALLITGGYSLCVRTDSVEQLVHLLWERLKEQKSMMGNSDITLFIKAGIRFDRAFLDVTKNSTLINMFGSLTDIFLLAVAQRQRHNLSYREDNLREHYALMRAVKEKRHDDVYRLISTHYDQPDVPAGGALPGSGRA